MTRGIVALLLLGFLASGQSPNRPKRLYEEIERSTDIAWLERLCTDLPFAETEFRARGFNTAGVKGNRSAAYVRLGVLGTPESLAAIARIEAAMRGRSILPPPARPAAPLYHPAPHMGDSTFRIAARTTSADGTEIGALVLDWYGPPSVFLAVRRSGAWSRPYLVPTVVSFDVSLSLASLPGGRLHIGLAAGPREGVRAPQVHPTPDALEVALDEVTRDSDGDGWTDVEERYLGLNPSAADTDRDGLPDGHDATPSDAGRENDPRADETQILRRAVFAVFGLTESPGALFVNDNSTRLRFDNLPGPVFYRDAAGGVRVRWKLLEKTASDAAVELSDYEGPLAASGNRIGLRRIGGDWYVVSIIMQWIS
jgi:hypothetical protein